MTNQTRDTRPRGRRLGTALVATVAAGVGLAGLTAAPAQAESVVLADRVGDAVKFGPGKNDRYFDIRQVRMQHAASFVRLRATRTKSSATPAFLRWWVDTGGDAGPEFQVTRTSFDRKILVSRTTGFGDTSGRIVCRAPKATSGLKTLDYAVTFDRSCLAGPGKPPPTRIRVSTQVEEDTVVDVDWAPRPRAYGPWLVAGRS